MSKNIENINESEDMSLETLLMEYAEATENATAEAKTILENAAKSSILNEYLEEEDETMEESQEVETEDKEKIDEAEDDDMEEVEVDDEGDELDMDTDDESDMEDEAEDDSDETSLEDELGGEDEEEFNPLSDFEPDEDGNYDLTNIDDPEKIMDIIANAPDGAEVVIVKSASYDVEVNDDAGMPDDEEPFDGGDMADEFQNEEDDMMGEADQTMQESEDEDDEYVNENVTQILKIKDKKLKIYEQKMQKMQNALRVLHEENETLKENEIKYKKTLNESKNYMEKLMILNKNLAHTSKLFTEHATTKAEKQEILKEFNEVETIRESERMYNFYKRQLDKKTSNNSAKQAILEEAKQIKKPKKMVKESMSYKKQEKDNEPKSAFMRIAKYKN